MITNQYRIDGCRFAIVNALEVLRAECQLDEKLYKFITFLIGKVESGDVTTATEITDAVTDFLKPVGWACVYVLTANLK